MDPINVKVSGQNIIDLFHWMFYQSQNTWASAKWMGVPCLQNPLDLWVMQEIISETKPDIIIETGTASGGSALFYVSANPRLQVISIDKNVNLESVPKFEHKNIWWKNGESTDPDVVADVRKAVGFGNRVMAILDSDHSTENVLAEMRLYGPMVSSGCYMVVNDTNVGGNPVHSPQVPGAGPMGAVKAFMEENRDFDIDKSREKFILTFHPNGWLKRK